MFRKMFKKKKEKDLSADVFSLFFMELMLMFIHDEEYRDNFLSKILTYRTYEIKGMLKLKCGDLEYLPSSNIVQRDNNDITVIINKCILNFDDYMKDYFKIKYKNKSK